MCSKFDVNIPLDKVGGDVIKVYIPNSHPALGDNPPSDSTVDDAIDFPRRSRGLYS